MSVDPCVSAEPSASSFCNHNITTEQIIDYLMVLYHLERVFSFGYVSVCCI
jgi:hypothetical protein